MAEFPRISYRLPLIAAALAASAAALPAAAQDVAAVTQVAAMSQAQDQEWGEDDYIVVGAIADPKKVALAVDPEDARLPEMPVVYETPTAAVKPAEPVSGS
jgi:hypothetical protein